MTCWVALGQAVALQIGLGLLILPSLSFCIGGNCEGHRGLGEGGREAGISCGSWQLWQRCGKSSQSPLGCDCRQTGGPSFTLSG